MQNFVSAPALGTQLSLWIIPPTWTTVVNSNLQQPIEAWSFSSPNVDLHSRRLSQLWVSISDPHLETQLIPAIVKSYRPRNRPTSFLDQSCWPAAVASVFGGGTPLLALEPSYTRLPIPVSLCSSSYLLALPVSFVATPLAYLSTILSLCYWVRLNAIGEGCRRQSICLTKKTSPCRCPGFRPLGHTLNRERKRTRSICTKNSAQ